MKSSEFWTMLPAHSLLAGPSGSGKTTLVLEHNNLFDLDWIGLRDQEGRWVVSLPALKEVMKEYPDISFIGVASNLPELLGQFTGVKALITPDQKLFDDAQTAKAKKWGDDRPLGAKALNQALDVIRKDIKPTTGIVVKYDPKKWNGKGWNSDVEPFNRLMKPLESKLRKIEPNLWRFLSRAQQAVVHKKLKDMGKS